MLLMASETTFEMVVDPLPATWSLGDVLQTNCVRWIAGTPLSETPCSSMGLQ
jgi:hypothetical protein